MNIVVDTRYLVPGQPYSASLHTTNWLNSLPHNPVIVLFYQNQQIGALTWLPANATELSAGPETTNNLLLQYGYNYKLPALLRKQKRTYFRQPKASVRCVPGSSMPVCT